MKISTLGRSLLLLLGSAVLLVVLIGLRFYRALPTTADLPAVHSDFTPLAQMNLRDGLAFPQGFFWGSATAAHQVEGGNTNNDWYLWEQARDAAGRCRIHNCEQSGRAVEHYQRYDQDFDLARALNQTMYRFSIEWSRIEPKEGVWDFEAIRHYRDVLASLKRHGLRPMVTLHHFTNPLWLAQSGGWKNPQTVDKFERYVRFVVDQFKGDVDWWVTINEPVVYAVMGYLYGEFPPGEKNLTSAFVVVSNLLRGHARAYRAIHELDTVDADGDGQAAVVGMAHHLRVFMPADPRSRSDQAVARIRHYYFNVLLLEAATTGRLQFNIPLVYSVDEQVPGLKGSMDFIGVNYYSRDLVAFDWRRSSDLFAHILYEPDRRTYSDMGEGWEIYPQGIFDLLVLLKRYNRPIFITENGVADTNGNLRPAFIAEHVYHIWRAVQLGIDVRGYLYWSLMDNFEWCRGAGPRFGLYRVDYQTQARTLTTGGELFRDIAGANALPPSIPVRLRSPEASGGVR